MGKGGGGSSKQTTTATPYLKSDVTYAAKQAKNLYGKGGPQYYPDQTYVDYSPETEQALGMISQRAQDGSPLMNSANATVQGTIDGNYLQGNPYIDEVINKSLGDVNKRYAEQVLPGLASNFAQSGRYGSGIQQQMTTDTIGQLGKEAMGVASGIRYDNYNQERQRQLQAAAMAPSLAQSDYFDAQQLMGVGSAREALSQAQLQDAMDRWNYTQNAPSIALDQYISRLGSLNTGGGTSTTTGPSAQRPGAGITGALSGGAAGLGLGTLLNPQNTISWAGGGSTALGGTMGALGGPLGIGLGVGGALLGGLFS